MEATTRLKPKTLAELLPDLCGILSEDAVQTLTAKKQPRQTIARTQTTEISFKPMTIAEMSSDIIALRGKSPRRPVQSASTVKKNWNSSVKVDKKISHTANGHMKNSNVRKVLNFQPKPKPFTNSRITMHHQASETPKFPKPEFRAKKSVLQARNNVRISGICNIPETPVINKPMKSRMTLVDKENISNKAHNFAKKHSSPKIIPAKSVAVTPIVAPVVRLVPDTPSVPDTPFSNQSWKSSCDASFLQKEKEINEIEAKTKAISEEHTLEKIADVSPPVSTPFKEYRNVQEYFNNSSELESSVLYNDNTIMCFDKPSMPKEDIKREESVIMSLCELLNKATVTTNDKTNTEISDLLQVEKQTEHNIKMIENGIKSLESIKEAQWKSLQYVRKLINEKTNCQMPESENDKTLTETKELSNSLKTETTSTNNSPILGQPCSVIKSCKSPSYKIPKKNLCLRKKVFYKSMPNVSNGPQSPNKAIEGRALNMYLKMKEQMNFLNTPLVKHRNIAVPDTPAVTSNNLRRQLDKLYGGS